MKKQTSNKVTLACSVCFQRNYQTPKNLALKAERLTLKKFCPRCGNHTSHQETK